MVKCKFYKFTKFNKNIPIFWLEQFY